MPYSMCYTRTKEMKEATGFKSGDFRVQGMASSFHSRTFNLNVLHKCKNLILRR
jgi:hypothetical protein